LRSIIGVFLGVVAVAVLTAVGGGTTANASTDRVGFTAQAEAAGLSAEKADALQAKVDRYLTKLQGHGKQVSPNQIDLGGAVLNVAVPGEAQPRQLVAPANVSLAVAQCVGSAAYQWFCAYQYEYRTGDHIGMWRCDNYFIPWYTTGSWENNQTAGTRPVMHFVSTPSQSMPAAYSAQQTGVYWNAVHSITNC